MNNAISQAPPAGADNGAAGQPRPPVLATRDASRRATLLADLQSALAALGVRSVLARHHRLVLRGGRTTPIGTRPEPSGPTDPELHILGPAATEIATTDGTAYHVASGTRYPADDPAAAAISIRRDHHVVRRA
jgi:hypothetical protein